MFNRYLDVHFTAFEWSSMQKFVSKRLSQSRFSAEFTAELNKKLQNEFEIDCYISNKHNWFKKNNSQKGNLLISIKLITMYSFS